MRKLGFATAILCATIAAATPALASDAAVAVGEAASALAPNGYVWSDPGDGQPVTIVVSLPLQRAFVYRGSALVAVTSVSTGRDGKDTPVGIYPILQKEQMHRSNLYNAAPMPFMQRLTWDGIAIHAGNNPGFPDSHGCIRVPAAFARKLFGVTEVGTTVVVTDQVVEDTRLDPGLLQSDAAAANAGQIALQADR